MAPSRLLPLEILPTTLKSSCRQSPAGANLAPRQSEMRKPMFRRKRMKPVGRTRRAPQRSCEALELRLTLDSTVVFNELMYHAASNDANLEWIELHNQMAVDMDLSNWRIAGGVEYQFAAGTILPGDGYLVV